MPTSDGAIAARQALRYAVGVALSVAVSQGFGWTLSYMLPVLVVLLLSSSPVPLRLIGGLQIALVITLCMFFGVVVTGLLLPYPVVAVVVIGLLIFSIFYMATGNTSPLTIIMLLVAVAVLPVVGQTSLQMVETVAKSLALAGAVAVLLQWVSFALVPPLPGAAATAAPRELADPETRLYSALRSSAVILPLQLAYLLTGATTLLVLIIAAVLAQQADLRTGMAATKAVVLANLLGGATAIAAYNLLVVVPSFTFLVLLMFTIALFFASRAFSDHPQAAVYGSAVSTILILVGSSVTPFADDAGAKFYQRLAQVMLGGLWVAVAFYLFPPRKAPQLAAP